MNMPPLINGTLIKRYKRFLADIRLDTGEKLTVHCPNSGSMLGCNIPSSTVKISKSDNPGRKYPYTWEMVQIDGEWVGIHTGRTNKLVLEALTRDRIPELTGYSRIRPEVRYGRHSRIDFLLTDGNRRCYVEVKNVTLVRNSIACFPDSVTTRGTKHLHELMDVVRSNGRAIIFFLVQRADAGLFRPAADIDPVYAQTLQDARRNGVEILVYQARVTPQKIDIRRALPWQLDF